MLTFESPFYEISGVVVFRDHVSPHTFHYLAGPPKLSTGPDGLPNLLLLKYKDALDALGGDSPLIREQLGGGFLMFGVDCGLTQRVKDEIIAELSTKVPPGPDGVNLVPVLYTKGTVNVIALDAQLAAADGPDDGGARSKFVRGILGTATPSLLQDQRAIFSLALSPDATTLIEEAYTTGLSPIGVMYELELTGLRPALSVYAKVDMKRVYEQFKLGLHLGFHTGGPATPATPAAPAAPVTPAAPAAVPVTPATPVTPAAPVTPATPAAPATPATPAAPVTPAAPAAPATPATPAATGTATATAPVTAPASGGNGTSPAAPATPAAGGATTPGAAGTGTAGTGTAGQTTTPATTTTTPTTTPTTVQVGIDAGLTYAVEQLHQSGAITIEIIRQQTGQSVEQMEQNALQLLKETLLNEFFKPAMTNVPAATQAMGAVNQMMAGTAATSQGTANPGGAAGTGGGTKLELGLQLQFKREEELKEAIFNYSVVAPETRTHAPNGFFSTLMSGTEMAQHVRQINLDSAFFKVLEVPITTTADFDRFDIASITVELQYGGTIPQPEVTASAVLTKAEPGTQRFRAFIDHDDASFRYRTTYDFGQAETIAAQHQRSVTPWRTSTSRALVVHPPEDVSMLQVMVQPGVVDWEVVNQIETTLAYQDDASQFHAERTFLVAPTSPRQDWIVRLSDPALTSYTLQNTWHLKDQSQLNGPVVTETRASLPVADPFVDRLPIRISPLVDAGNVVRVDLELTYLDPAHHFEVHKGVGLVGPDFSPVTQTIPLINPLRREYTYQATLIKKNSEAERQPAVTTDALSILVTEGGAYFDVLITLLGDMAQAGLQAVQVDLRAEPLDGGRMKVESRLFQPGGTAPPNPVRLLLRVDRPQQFEYRTTAYPADRAPVESPWTKHQNSNLVLQPARLLTA